MAVLTGGKSGGKGKTGKSGGKGKPASKSTKPSYQPVKPGKTSPGTMYVKSPKPVKSSTDRSSNHGHAFGYFRLGIEKRK